MSVDSNLDLTEFVSKLIHDTFNAINVSSKEQAETYFELTKLASLDFESFKDKHIQGPEIDDELTLLFPSDKPQESPHLIATGLPYKYDRETGEEFPAIKRILDFDVSKEQKESEKLFDETVAKIRALVQDRLARQHYQSFQEIVKRGIPRVIIDSGRILAKISLQSTQREESGEETTSTSSSTASATSTTRTALSSSAFATDQNLLSKRIKEKLVKTRVGVTLPDPTSTTTQTNSTLWGEIEIKFRTVD